MERVGSTNASRQIAIALIDDDPGWRDCKYVAIATRSALTYPVRFLGVYPAAA